MLKPQLQSLVYAGASTGALVGTIVGAIIGVVLVTLLVTFLLYRVHRARRQRRDSARGLGKPKQSDRSSQGLFDSVAHVSEHGNAHHMQRHGSLKLTG